MNQQPALRWMTKGRRETEGEELRLCRIKGDLMIEKKETPSQQPRNPAHQRLRGMRRRETSPNRKIETGNTNAETEIITETKSARGTKRETDSAIETETDRLTEGATNTVTEKETRGTIRRLG